VKPKTVVSKARAHGIRACRIRARRVCEGAGAAIFIAMFLAFLLIESPAGLLNGPGGAVAAPAIGNPHGKTFKDWRIRCNKPTGAPSECQMFQNVVVKESGEPVLRFVVGYMDGVKTPVGVFILPLGIYLPPGLTLQVDKGQTYEMTIEICAPKGCRVRFSFDDKLLATFKRGKKAEIIFYSGGRKAVRVPVSLNGFSAALGVLR